jgi:SAM-dependent methyltransferase
MDVLPLERHERHTAVIRACGPIWTGSVLDVGCRTREVERALAGTGVRYCGVDLDPSAEVVANVGERLPFDDASFDVVMALDVLEHADDFHLAFAEVCRVARRHIVITLPNLYFVGVRLRHLLGHQISEKYGLPLARPADRHRWFFSLNDARAFIAGAATEHGWRVTGEWATRGPRARPLARLVERWPNLLSPTYLAVLQPGPAAGAATSGPTTGR